jgi:isocitrate dehydrogenase kinase/phosphatase
MPEASTDDEETSGEPWFSVSPNDVFPQELPTFIFTPGHVRELFMELHADLADPAFWIATQDRIRAGIQDDVFPYPEEIRFRAT